MNMTISLPASYRDQLQREKERTGAPMSSLIRLALDLYFKGEQNGHPEGDLRPGK